MRLRITNGRAVIQGAALTLKKVRAKIYQYTPKDYRGTWNGKKSILKMNKQTGGTELVVLDDLTPEEMVDQLRYKSKAVKDLGFEGMSEPEMLEAIKGLKG